MVYQDIIIIEGLEINSKYILNKIYSILHIEFVKIKKNNTINIGVSFPHYNSTSNTLGNIIRLFYLTKNDALYFDLVNKTSRYSSYCRTSEIRSIPESCSYGCFYRSQFKSNKDRLARRKAKREKICFEEAFEKLGDFNEQKTKLPFINLKSSSNSNNYKLFINYKDCKKNDGTYNTYGLSGITTVPIF